MGSKIFSVKATNWPQIIQGRFGHKIMRKQCSWVSPVPNSESTSKYNSFLKHICYDFQQGNWEEKPTKTEKLGGKLVKTSDEFKEMVWETLEKTLTHFW